jgi:hypothetical protein
MTTMIQEHPIKNLSCRLKHIDKKLGKNIVNYLPDWWDDELKDSAGAVQQLQFSIARFANLEIETVLNKHAELRFRESECQYKMPSNKTQFELKTATALVNSLARTVAAINTREYTAFSDALSIRKEFFCHGRPCVDFKSLVHYCWTHGVPVLYIPQLPVTKKMDAVVININNSPVIALTKKHKHESELLFLLAHEIGHIFYDHISCGQMIVDNRITESKTTDTQEIEANAFAIALLTGEENTRFHSNGKKLSKKELAELADIKAKQCNIDAGHIILNWGHTTKDWSIAKAALNILYPSPDWEAYIRQEFINNIDESLAQGDSLDYLYKLMQIGD